MSCLKVELIAWQAYVRNQKIKKENMNLQFYLQLFTITKMKVKCKVTSQFTDEIFNLAKPVQKRQTLTDSVVLYQSAKNWLIQIWKGKLHISSQFCFAFLPLLSLWKTSINIQEIRLRIVIFAVTVLLQIIRIYTLHESLIFKIIKVH